MKGAFWEFNLRVDNYERRYVLTMKCIAYVCNNTIPQYCFPVKIDFVGGLFLVKYYI